MADDDLAAALAPIRERAAACDEGFFSDGVACIRSAGDVPRLLAVVDAVLNLADKWVDDAGNQLVITYNDPALNDAAAAVSHKSASVRRTLAAELRSAVLAGLTGRDDSGGTPAC